MIEINSVYNEDCLETMKRMEDNFIDMTVTSPPYDNLRNYDGYDFDIEAIAKSLFRVTKEGGVVVWVVMDEVINGSETGTSFRQALTFKEVGFNLHDTMIWDKESSRFPESIRYPNAFEYMFVFSKGKPKTFNCIKDRRNRNFGQKKRNSTRSVDGVIGSKQKSGRLGMTGSRFNIWKYSPGHNKSTKDNFAYEHPAIFPEKLASDHIISWSDEGDLVYDPMSGSGTTLKMAKLNNRNYIGSEISKKYCEIIDKRLIVKPLIMGRTRE